MNSNQIIETQLDCRATASLKQDIVKDLSMPDRPIDELLLKTKEDHKDESEKSQQGSI
jgi:hypothetical protein